MDICRWTFYILIGRLLNECKYSTLNFKLQKEYILFKMKKTLQKERATDLLYVYFCANILLPQIFVV